MPAELFGVFGPRTMYDIKNVYRYSRYVQNTVILNGLGKSLFLSKYKYLPTIIKLLKTLLLSYYLIQCIFLIMRNKQWNIIIFLYCSRQNYCVTDKIIIIQTNNNTRHVDKFLILLHGASYFFSKPYVVSSMKPFIILLYYLILNKIIFN